MPVMNGMGAQVYGFTVAPRIPIMGTAVNRKIGTARGLDVPLHLAILRAAVGTHASDNTSLGPVLTGGGSGLPGQPSAAVVVDHPTAGPIAVAVPAPVAAAIQAGDPNAAAAVNAAAGGSPGGAATPMATGTTVSTPSGDVWGPRLFGLGILAAGAALVFFGGRLVK
jgi:hypothetical protein